MSQYTTRPLKEQDIESIIAIDALVTGVREKGGPDRAGFWRGLLSIYSPVPLEDSGGTPGIESVVQPHMCVVAEAASPSGASAGPRIAGFIIGDVQSWQFGIPRHGRIVTIGVHPEHRRHGVASLLAEALLDTFRKMGLPFVHCLARPEDTLGEFFRSVGFSRSDFEILEKSL
jgi:ribosomal protein S18 acetylase RimI-like enzyme